MDNTLHTPKLPLISVIMANFNGAKYIARALHSVLAQTHHAIELIVSDDGSTDQSVTIVQDIMANDDRVRLIRSPASTGPAAARNRALQMATGAWVAVIDSDDLIHPERLARLLMSAEALQADIVADDLIFFSEDLSEGPRTLFQNLDLARPEMVNSLALITGTLPGQRDVALGYIKPLIRRAVIGDIRYNEDLRVDEDHDFYLRLLLDGARCALIPDAMYLYRRHAASLSHRFSVAKLEPMIAAQDVLLRRLDTQQDLRAALAQRIKGHKQQLHYAHLIELLKARHFPAALGQLIRHPANWRLLIGTMKERSLHQSQTRTKTRPRMTVILCAPGALIVDDYPDFTVVQVPDVPSTGWAHSSAATWANLARLACAYDLHVIAVGRAGVFALGVVPQYLSARIAHSDHDLQTMTARGPTSGQPPRSAQYARSL